MSSSLQDDLYCRLRLQDVKDLGLSLQLRVFNEQQEVRRMFPCSPPRPATDVRGHVGC